MFVDGDGYREILGAAEGASENKECWKSFLLSLKERGLKGMRLFTSDKHLGFLESASEIFPDVKWQRSIPRWPQTKDGRGTDINSNLQNNLYL